MAYSERGGLVVLELKREDYELLLFILGTALGHVRRQDQATFWRQIEFVNRLNEGNPHYQPYEVPGKFKTDADLPRT